MRTPGRIFNCALIASVGIGLSACASLMPDAVQPELPTQWHATPTPAGATVDRDWWRNFGSDELADLVQSAEQQSLDLAAAEARVRQAAATERMASAALWPSLTGEGEAARSGRLGGSAEVSGSSVGAGLAASYEVDLWGRLRANRAGALASLQASTFDRDALRLSVTAAVASTWLQMVALRERITIGESHLATAERLLALIEARARAGAATSLEVVRQRGLLASQRRALASVRQQAEDVRTALLVLLGQTQLPASRSKRLADLSLPLINAGLPAELLSRRPDIARAEARLAAANADVLAARAALLPSLNLDARVGGSDSSLHRVFENPIYSLAAALSAPIFNAGRLAAGRDLAEARREELLASYRQSIVTAFGEVETAVNATRRLDEQVAAQAEELAHAERALVLAESRYRAGAETPIVLLDSQRSLYATQDAATQLKLARLQAAVALYRALGGGWSHAGKNSPAAARPRTTP
ncbi:efflux transporter outer membrane subunit [Rhodocyclus tenuis]|nr:efflux transporter outer membrane subunit [Rhodocyclus tenuis]